MEKSFLKELSILYVEDDDFIRDEMAEFLSRRFRKIYLAENGSLGVDLFKKHHIDIIITDINMPIINGLDMSKIIKGIDSSVPIIVTTAYDDTELLIEAIDIGVDKYVLKPIKLENIVNAIFKCAEQLFHIREIEKLNSVLQDNLSTLREKTLYLDNILRYSTDMAIMAINLDFRIKYYNPVAENIFGYSADEVIGKTVMEMHILQNVDHIRFLKAIDIVRKEGEYKFTIEMSDNGNDRIVSARLSGIRDKENVLIGFVMMANDITQKRQSDLALRETRKRLQSIMDNTKAIIYIKDRTGRYMMVNRQMENLLDISKDEIIGKTDYDVFPGEAAAFFHTNDRKVLDTETHFSFEEVFPHRNELFTYLSIKFPLYDTNGNAYAICGISTDITERKKMEKQIRSSLREKEVLLKEIHHRVKNNMQIVSSLLKLQSRYIKDSEYKEIFKESESRIRSMALVHEKLYSSKDLSSVVFEDYIQNIAHSLFSSYGINNSRVKLIVRCCDTLIGLDTAVPCGMIINELLTNSLKYAFPENREGEIVISLQVYAEEDDTERIELTVSDNGIGFPDEFDCMQAETLGLQLVTAIAVDQLQGTIELNKEGGAEFVISFNKLNSSV